MSIQKARISHGYERFSLIRPSQIPADSGSIPPVPRPQDPAEYEAKVVNAYRAIGRHIVKFSSLVAEMRTLIVARITDESTLDRAHVKVFWAEVAAGKVADDFFALCNGAGRLDGPS